MHGGGGRDIELIYGGWRRGRRNERKKERCASNEKESEILILELTVDSIMFF